MSKKNIKIGDEVHVPGTMKHGIVYRVSRGKCFFVDAMGTYGESFIENVIFCSGFSESEKRRIINRHRIVKEKK